MCHKETTSQLKSAFLVIGDVKEVGKMEEEANGAVGVRTNSP